MGNNRLSNKQVGSQASRRVTLRLVWIQPVCISINAVPALKGFNKMAYNLFISGSRAVALQFPLIQFHPYFTMFCDI